MILNMISTSIMIKLGRVKGNRMVNMQLTNKKLIDRGTRMIIEELGLDYDHAKRLLLMYGSVRKLLRKSRKQKESKRTIFKFKRNKKRLIVYPQSVVFFIPY